MTKEIFIAGAPSLLGGADSEILHNITLWRMNDVEIHIVPMFGLSPEMKQQMESIGCKVHSYNKSIFKDKIVISYCNGEFLRLFREIIENGKPRCVAWANCMTWAFPRELEAHKNGWIDYHIFVSNYQKKWLLPELEKIAPVRELEGYRPYFDIENKSQQIAFNYRKPDQYFALGRISRDDSAKYSPDMWKIFNKVLSPISKKVFILGFGPNAHKKTGPAPQGLDWQTFRPNEIPVRHMYNLLHCIIHKTGGSRESYCRILPEAYAFGVPFICERDYAFPDLVVDGVTGYMCSSSDEMSFRASELAFDEEKRKKMIFTAREYLVNEIANVEKCWEPWRKLLEEHGDK